MMIIRNAFTLLAGTLLATLVIHVVIIAGSTVYHLMGH